MLLYEVPPPPRSFQLLQEDAKRYRWLRLQYAKGEETYLAEDIISEKQLDRYIDFYLKMEQKMVSFIHINSKIGDVDLTKPMRQKLTKLPIRVICTDKKGWASIVYLTKRSEDEEQLFFESEQFFSDTIENY